jgi:hypothetical protein
MVDRFQAIVVTVLAVLPGALYVWGLERQLGGSGIHLADRPLRFIGYSAAFHALLWPVDWWLYGVVRRDGGLVASRPVPAALWAVPIAFVLLPFLAGRAVGAGATRKRRWAVALAGGRRTPRAWDRFFSSRPSGWIRVKLKSGSWVGGYFSDRPDLDESYAAKQPGEQSDFYLGMQAWIDPASGDFEHDEFGSIILRGSGMLIRWDEVEYLEFYESA